MKLPHRFLLFFLASPALLQGCKSTDSDVVDTDAEHELSWLFVQTASSGSFNGKTLTLNEVPAALAFTDRPDRITGHLKTQYLIAAWDDGEDSFEVDPPNAVLSTFGTGAQPTLATIVLSEPVLEDGTLSYTVEVLDGIVPTRFEEASLFIDDWHHPWLGGFLLGAAGSGGYGYDVDPGPQANNPPVAHGDSSYLTYYQNQGAGQQKQRKQQPRQNKKQPQKNRQPPEKPAPKKRKHPTLEQKLTKLKQFHDGGLITDEEYEKRQEQLLDRAMKAQP